MTENNLLGKYIRQLEAFIPFKKEITNFLPCYLMTQEFISLEAVQICLMRPKHCCQAIKVFIVSLISFISRVADNHQPILSHLRMHTHRHTHSSWLRNRTASLTAQANGCEKTDSDSYQTCTFLYILSVNAFVLTQAHSLFWVLFISQVLKMAAFTNTNIHTHIAGCILQKATSLLPVPHVFLDPCHSPIRK